MMPNQQSRIQFTLGFTIIELLVVIAIIAILAIVAIPKYTDYVRESRRSDAINALATIQLNQVKWRTNNLTYGVLSDVWSGTASIDDHYTLAFKNAAGADVSPTATGYTVRATPKAGDDQTNDTCKGFVLTITGSSVDNDVSDDATETKERCWQR